MSKWHNEPRLCKDCKWWKDALYDEPYRSTHSAFNDRTMRYCGHPKINDGMDNEDIEVECNADSMKSYEVIETEGNFGCIHWEGKDDRP